MKISIMALVASLISTSAFAAEAGQAAQAVTQSADTSFSVGEIIVSAKGMAGSSDNLLTSVDRLGGDIAQKAEVRNVYELIGQMPGVQVTDFNQGTSSGKFSMRGFNGEGNINAVKLLIDGVPSNSNDGNMPYIDMTFPLNIAGIEVVRGTSDPRYGLHAIAGSADILTRTGGTYMDARLSTGSYETYEGQVVAGFESGAFTQNYQFAYRDSAGYRDHSNGKRFSLSGKWGLTLNEVVRLTAIARYYDATALEAGYLTYTDSRINPRMSNTYNVADSGTRTMKQYALKGEVSFTEHLDWSSAAYMNRLHDDRLVKFSAGAAQQRRLTQEDHYGLSTSLHWHGGIAGMPLMLEVGGNIEWQDNQSLRWLAAGGVTNSQTRDQQFDLNVGGVYIQAIVEPASWIRLTPAYRVDWVGGRFTNILNGTSAPINDYGSIYQPKLSVAILPFDGGTLYGNWGKTYQIGLGSGAYLIPPRENDLAPSMNEGWEVGGKYRLGHSMEARLAYWEQSATGETARKLNDPFGDFENVGSTTRKGVDVQLSVKPASTLSIWGTASWQTATIRTPPPSTPQYVGNVINHTPHWLWSGGLDWSPTKAFNVSLTARGQSSYYLTTANAEGKWGAMMVIDASTTFRLKDTVELGLTVKNLGNAFYEYVWWDGVESLHSPAARRNVTGSVRMRF